MARIPIDTLIQTKPGAVQNKTLSYALLGYDGGGGGVQNKITQRI